MNLIVKQASALTSDELSSMGLTGIPSAWIIESYPYTGTVPTGFTEMSDTDASANQANNQAAYDAWVASIKVQTVAAPPYPTNAAGVPLQDVSYQMGLTGASSLTVNSHDYSDRTTWYQRSVKVTSETLVDSGNGLTFNSANANWVNMDSDRLTYDYKMVPERDGTFTDRSDRRPIVLVNGTQLNDVSSPATPGYTVNYAAGTITFTSSQSGNTVVVTYWHNNSVSRCSEWIVNPPPTMAYLLNYVEVQFSKTITFTTPIHIEAWAGADVGTYSDFSNTLYDAGYGQNKSVYRGAKDFTNICTNRESAIIPAFGGLTADIYIYPFDYLLQTQIRSDQGTLIMTSLENDTAYSNAELATITFYMQIVPVTSL